MSMRVLMIPCGGLDNGSARTRMYAYLSSLKKAGVEVFVESYTYHKYHRADERPCGLNRIWLELLPLRSWIFLLGADVVWHQKLSGKPIKMGIARLFGKRVVFDLDDAVYLTSPFDTPNAVWSERDCARVESSLRKASIVVASGKSIQAYASGLNQHVATIPTIVEAVADAPSKPRTQGVIGWVGAPENQRFLRQIEAPLLRMTAERPELEVWIMTSKLMDPPPRFRHRFIPWSRAAEQEFVPQFTVGLAPLDDTEWCRAKMNYKALVYMSYGVPAVVSPIGFPVWDFQDGDAVNYASSSDKWYAAIDQHLRDRDARDRMAEKAIRILKEKYTAESRAGEFLAVLRG